MAHATRTKTSAILKAKYGDVWIVVNTLATLPVSVAVRSKVKSKCQALSVKNYLEKGGKRVKTEIWCKSEGQMTKAVKARVLDYILPECDFITVWEGWSLEKVHERIYHCHSQTLIVVISHDTHGEYAEKAREEGFI